MCATMSADSKESGGTVSRRLGPKYHDSPPLSSNRGAVISLEAPPSGAAKAVIIFFKNG